MKKIYHMFGRSALCLLLLSIIMASTAFASPKEEARQRLQTAVNEISATLSKSDLTNLSENSPVINKLESLILNIFSLDQFSMRTVGKKWRTFTPAQKEAFKKSFIDLLKTTYFSHISAYENNKVAITGERTNKKGDKVEVLTTVAFKGKNVPVNYRMLNYKGSWMVYDVVVEGVSLVKNYRTQFKELLRHGTPDELIAKLQDKASRIRKKRMEEAKQ